MRIKRRETETTIWLSADDTYRWANRDGAVWPCSELAGKRLRATVSNDGDLLDISCGGRECLAPGDEVSAMLEDHLPECC